jgi:hypothetical protein
MSFVVCNDCADLVNLPKRANTMADFHIKPTDRICVWCLGCAPPVYLVSGMPWSCDITRFTGDAYLRAVQMKLLAPSWNGEGNASLRLVPGNTVVFEGVRE